MNYTSIKRHIWQQAVRLSATVQHIITAIIGMLLLLTGATLSAADPGPIRYEAEELSGLTYAPGHKLSEITFSDISGKPGRFDVPTAPPATVIAVRDATCPISKKYGPTLARLEQGYADRGVRFLYLNLSASDSVAAMQADKARYHLRGRYIVDRDQHIGAMLGVTSTADVFVLDHELRPVYRGAINDQYGIGFSKPAPTQHYLRDALAAVLAGKPPPVAATTAPGCFLKPGRHTTTGTGLTWYGDIERLVQTNCQECHRPGEIGPFPLLQYADVAARTAMIRFVLNNRIMPPWFAEAGSGPWSNKLQLGDAERASIIRWIDQGAPAGKPADGPRPVNWVEGWRTGKPDAVLQVEEPFQLPAEGVIPYMYATIQTDFDEDKWIQGFEVRSLAQHMAHHILVFIDRTAGDPDPDLLDPEDMVEEIQMPGGWSLDGFFAGTIVGAGGVTYPAGTAKRLPKGARLRIQMHYTASGVAAEDQPMIGLRFATAPPAEELRTLAASTIRIMIPAHAANHPVEARYEFTEDGRIAAFLPHMHLRGKAFRYVLERPDGSREKLLEVPRYDPNWQLLYQLQTPVEVKSGSILHATAWYDNSRANPANPDPDATVLFGTQIWDEMMIGYFDWVTANPDAPTTLAGASPPGGEDLAGD